jgi:hypothetical protein
VYGINGRLIKRIQRQPQSNGQFGFVPGVLQQQCREEGIVAYARVEPPPRGR